MKINFGKLAKTVTTFAKDNPEIALGMAGVALKVAPKAVRKAAPIVLPIVLAQLSKPRATTAE